MDADSSKFSICFLTRRFPPAVSGMSTFARNLIKHLSIQNHNITIVSQYRGDTKDNVYRDGPPEFIPGALVIGMQQYAEEKEGDFETDIDRLVQMIGQLHREYSFDLVHAQYGYPPGFAALLASRQFDIPTVVSIQGGDGHWVGKCCQYHRKVMQAVLNYSDEIVVGTKSFGEEVKKNNLIEREFRIVPGATDASHFIPVTSKAKIALRKKYKIPTEPRIVLYHGRIDRRKGLGDLISALSILNNGGLNFQFVLSGVGPDKGFIESLLVQNDLQNKTTILGYVEYERANEIYSLADVYCMPTLGEGFSNTIVEALASGLPVISTRVVGVKDVFENTRSVVLVKEHEVDRLASELERLIQDTDLRIEMGEHGRDLVTEQYSWEKASHQFIDIYKDVVEKQRKKPTIKLPAPDPNCIYRETPQLL